MLSTHLGLLRTAIIAGDPKKELLLRVDDMEGLPECTRPDPAEGLREILEEAKRRALEVHGYSSVDKINEALALLTTPAASVSPGDDLEKLHAMLEVCKSDGFMLDGDAADVEYIHAVEDVLALWPLQSPTPPQSGGKP